MSTSEAIAYYMAFVADITIVALSILLVSSAMDRRK